MFKCNSKLIVTASICTCQNRFFWPGFVHQIRIFIERKYYGPFHLFLHFLTLVFNNAYEQTLYAILSPTWKGFAQTLSELSFFDGLKVIQKCSCESIGRGYWKIRIISSRYLKTCQKIFQILLHLSAISKLMKYVKSLGILTKLQLFDGQINIWKVFLEYLCLRYGLR